MHLVRDQQSARVDRHATPQRIHDTHFDSCFRMTASTAYDRANFILRRNSVRNDLIDPLVEKRDGRHHYPHLGLHIAAQVFLNRSESEHCLAPASHNLRNSPPR